MGDYANRDDKYNWVVPRPFNNQDYYDINTQNVSMNPGNSYPGFGFTNTYYDRDDKLNWGMLMPAQPTYYGAGDPNLYDRWSGPQFGLGALDFSSPGNFLSSVESGIASGDVTTIALVGGAALALMMLFGRSDSTAYAYESERLRKKYPRRVSRLSSRFSS
jgi:hypothetical protein